MKKIVLSIIVLLTTISSFAQTGTSAKSGSHLQFEGITMNGEIRAFCSKLEKKGYTYEMGTKAFGKLKGDFMGCKDCDVAVCGGTNFNLISNIFIEKSTNNKDEKIKYYSTLKKNLVEKYGKPSFCKENFKCIIEPTTKNERFYAKDEEIKYMTTFNLKNGIIMLGMQEESVIISYLDNINYSLMKKSCPEDMD
ncbi:MAG: hypothetical protein WC140_07705 [Bacteroidales bacterium]